MREANGAVTGSVPGTVRPPARRRPARLPLAVLILVAAGFLGLGLAEAWSDSPTFDEPVYVAAGLAAVLHHDVTLNDEHPPLPKVLAVLPVLLTHPVIPGNGKWSGNDEQSDSARFVSAQLSAGILRRVTFASRLVPLAESAGWPSCSSRSARSCSGRREEHSPACCFWRPPSFSASATSTAPTFRWLWRCR